MRKKSFKNRSVNTISAIVGASALVMGMGFSQPVQASDPFLAEINMFGGNFNPRGWAFCNGQLLQISQNSALFSLLGTTYGGDGRVTFALPDLRGRVAVHDGGSAGPGLARVRIGQKGGTESHTLTTAQMPSHNHSASTTASTTATLRGTNSSGDSNIPGGNTQASKSRTNIYSTGAPNVDMHAASITAATTATTTIGNTGGGQSFSIRDPYLGVNFIIALQGTFPSRN